MLDLGQVFFQAVAVQSPFLIFCSYGAFRRFPKIASEYLVFPAVIATCAFFFTWRLFNLHFLFAGAFILTAYSIMVFKLRYWKVDAIVISALMMIALDQIWQFPLYVVTWTNWITLEAGLRMAGWNLMAFPLLFYFLLKANGRIKLDALSRDMLLLCIVLTILDFENFSLSLLQTEIPYLLIIPWFGFFLTLFRSSSRP